VDTVALAEVENRGSLSTAEAPINVFVHLARNKDASEWWRAREAGTLVGVNDETPYGYGRAASMGCRVTFSRSSPEGPIGKVLRLGIRVLLGCDYLHALRQGEALTTADVVWTHTESQYLAVAAVLMGKARRPKLLGQSVWLFDRWRKFGPLRRALYRRLISEVDVLTFHSEENLAIARALFPDKRLELVHFGIASEESTEPMPRPASPLRILSVGNDRDRDWKTLIAAFKGCEYASVQILSETALRGWAQGAANVRVMPAKSNVELAQHFAAATVVCVPLKPNNHASGITAIQEAVLAGVPVVVSDTGGLVSYFGRDELRYVPPSDPVALREAIMETASDPVAARNMAVRAQARLTGGKLGLPVYIRQHVELSREMLKQ
jgi:glycosyltransferase involved in cell wall biosynthesis